jgi:hypothetical protein
MKLKQTAIALAAIVLLFTACKDAKKEEPKKMETLGDLVKAVEGMGKDQEQQADKWAERRAKGDTLAIPYKELQNYLPDAPGYTKEGGPKGEQMTMPMMGSISSARQNYTGGGKSLEIEIMDYNAAFQGFSMAAMPYKMGISSEDDNMKTGPVSLGIADVIAYETIHKNTKAAELVLIVADRFLIKLDGSQMEDSGTLQRIAKSMKLGELAAK